MPQLYVGLFIITEQQRQYIMGFGVIMALTHTFLAAMKVSNEINVKNKIFSETDVVNILTNLVGEYKLDKSSGKRLEIKLTCEDESEYGYSLKDGSVNTFIDNILTIKKITKVEGEYRNFDKDRFISIKLDSDSSLFNKYKNRIRVSGNDQIWTDGKIKYYFDFLSRVKQRGKYIDLAINSAQEFVFFVVGYSVLYLLINVLKYIGYQPNNDDAFMISTYSKFPIIGYGLLIMFSVPIGMAASTFIKILDLDWVREMFPSVELNFVGNEISQKEKLNNILKKTIEIFIYPFFLWLGVKIVNIFLL